MEQCFARQDKPGMNTENQLKGTSLRSVTITTTHPSTNQPTPHSFTKSICLQLVLFVITLLFVTRADFASHKVAGEEEPGAVSAAAAGRAAGAVRTADLMRDPIN